MAQPAVRTVDVTLTDDRIEPRQIWVPANYPVRFVVENKGGRSHQFMIPSRGYGIQEVLPGQTREAVFTFVDVGTFEIVSCDDDDQTHGLRAELVVQNLL
jgi:heme/copper-type cytochrome/quinol oxidase subunit 2